jgi:predicted Zn-dependent peptidase
VFEGSEHYPSGKELVDELSKNGSYYNGHTNNYVNQYVSRVAPEDLNRVLGVMIDMIYRPIFSEQGLDEEREVVARELDENRGDYGLVANFMNSNQSLPDASVDLIEQEDLIAIPTMDDIKAYHKKFYTANNTKIVISGDLPAEKQAKIKALLKKELDRLPAGKKYTAKALEVHKPDVPALPIETPSDITTLNVSLAFVKKGKLDTKAYQPLGVFGTLISAAEQGSIYHYLRKKGLLYSLGASPLMSQESYSLEIDFVCDRGSYGRVLAEVLLKLKEFSHVPRDEEVLQRFKDNIAGSLLIGCETPTDYMNWYEDFFIHDDKPESPEAIATAINEITSDDIQSLTQPLIANENLHITIMGGDAGKYLELTDTIRKTVFSDKPIDAEQLLVAVEAEQERIQKSQPIATWATRILLVLLVAASFVPSIIDNKGTLYSLWSLGWANDDYSGMIATGWLIIAAISSLVLRFGNMAKEVFAIVAIFYIVMWLNLTEYSNIDADIESLFGQVAASVLTVAPIILLALSAGQTFNWLKSKLRRS